jgi:hypothetical protein
MRAANASWVVERALALQLAISDWSARRIATLAQDPFGASVAAFDVRKMGHVLGNRFVLRTHFYRRTRRVAKPRRAILGWNPEQIGIVRSQAGASVNSATIRRQSAFL